MAGVSRFCLWGRVALGRSRFRDCRREMITRWWFPCFRNFCIWKKRIWRWMWGREAEGSAEYAGVKRLAGRMRCQADEGSSRFGFGATDFSVKARASLSHSKGALHGIGVGVGIDCRWVDCGRGFGARLARRMAVAADGGFRASSRSGGRGTDGARVGALIQSGKDHVAGGASGGGEVE